MAVNPYGLAGAQSGLLSSLLKSEQQKKEQQSALGMQKGKMTEEFEKELIGAQAKAEKELAKKRKKKGLLGLFESVAPLLGLIPGVGTGLSAGLGALGGMMSMYGQSKHARGQVDAARRAMQLPGMEKWQRTFLGSKARDVEAESGRKFDELARAAKVSAGDILTKGLTSGVASYAMGKVGEKIGGAVKGQKGLKAAEKLGKEGITVESISPKGEVGFTWEDDKALDFLSKDPDKLLNVIQESGLNPEQLLKLGESKNPFMDLLVEGKGGKGGLKGMGTEFAGNKDLLQSLLMALGPAMEAGEGW